MDYVKLYSDPAIDKHIDAAGKKYNDHMEKMIGVGLNMPCECENSAARKDMFASQYQQHVCLVNPEIPYLATGYENLFGHHSSSYVKADRTWRVFAKIEKFSNRPGHHYYLIVIDENNNMDVIERVSYCYNTETYGFIYDTKYLDSLEVGSIIKKDTTIKKSHSFDFFDNYMPGKNLRVMYVSDARTTEDAIEVSKSASLALARTEFKTVTILINDNNIPLNLYGDDKSYRFIPDIGEEVKNGILCGIRTENNDESFFTQSAERLKIPMINDVTFKADGKVVDINIYCNKDIASSNNGIYEGQLAFYDADYKRFCKEFVNVMKNYIENTDYTKSSELSILYGKCKDVVQGKLYFKDNVFSNIIIEVTLYKPAPLEEGDKVTSRYGGKGVISKVIDDDMMPVVHETGERVDLIWNIATCVNRLNPGQLFEMSLNFISSKLAAAMMTPIPTEDCIDLIYKFYNHLSQNYAYQFAEWIGSCATDDEVEFTVANMLTEDGDGLYLSLEPISEAITFEKLMKLYGEYPWIKPVFLDVPIIGSRGQLRYVQSQKPCIVAKQYIYRMKQNAEEKHSATALSATNIRNMNSKSKASKMYIRIHSNTPIRFGEMEGNIFKAMGAEIDAINMMIYSNSPVGRRDAKQMLTSYKFDVKLSENAKSRSAEILNSILKAMGVEFKFTKIPIKYDDPFATVDDSDLFYFINPMEDQLFQSVDTVEKQLFMPVDKAENLLFATVNKLEDQLFEKRGE
jgi:DNA-directed RNA polymerase beta subunit